GDAIDEVPSCRGATVENREVMPPEHDDARPRARLTARLPRSVLELSDRAANRSDTLTPGDLTAHRRRRLSPPRKLTEPRRAKRAAREQEREPLQEVRFSLGVQPDEEVQSRRRRVSKGAIITEF